MHQTYSSVLSVILVVQPILVLLLLLLLLLILILISSGTSRCLTARPDALSHRRAAQFRQRLTVPRAFRQHFTPKPLGLGMIAALRGKGRQIAPGQVAIDTLIHAAKLVGAFQAQYPPPRLLCLGWLAPMPVHDPLAKPQLGILRVKHEPLEARLDRRLRITHHLVRTGDQGIQFAHDRVARRRADQALIEKSNSLLPILPLDGDSAQLKAHERVVRPLAVLALMDAINGRGSHAKPQRRKER